MSDSPLLGHAKYQIPKVMECIRSIPGDTVTSRQIHDVWLDLHGPYHVPNNIVLGRLLMIAARCGYGLTPHRKKGVWVRFGPAIFAGGDES